MSDHPHPTPERASDAPGRVTRPAVTATLNRGRICVRWAGLAQPPDMPGARWTPDLACHTLSPTPAAAEQVARAARAADAALVADDHVTRLIEQARRAYTARALRHATDLDDLPSRPGVPPAWLHQRQAFHFARELDAAMLAMWMGTGKTRVAVALLDDWSCERVLVLAPRNVTLVWPAMVARYSPREWDAENGRAPGGSWPSVAKRADRARRALELATARGRPLLVCANLESAWRSPLDRLLLSAGWDCVIVDESHAIKGPGGKASQFAHQIGRRAARRLALTGTPSGGSPEDIYAQYRFLDDGVFGTSFAAFKARYVITRADEIRSRADELDRRAAEHDERGDAEAAAACRAAAASQRQRVSHVKGAEHTVVGTRNADDLAARFASLAYQCGADRLDLPPQQWVERTVVLGAKARRAHDDLWDRFVADVDGETITAANAMVKLLRVQQVTGGHVPTEDGTPIRVGTEKRDQLADDLAGIHPDHDVVVACRFTCDLDSVREAAEAAGRAYAELSGRRTDALDDDGRLTGPPGLVAGVQIRSGGAGVDLSRAHYAVNYSVGYSLIDWQQWLARTWRPGQEHPVVYLNYAAEDTHDADVFAALQRKEDGVEAMLRLARAGGAS